MSSPSIATELWTPAQTAAFLGVDIGVYHRIRGLPRVLLPGGGPRPIVRHPDNEVRAWAEQEADTLTALRVRPAPRAARAPGCTLPTPVRATDPDLVRLDRRTQVRCVVYVVVREDTRECKIGISRDIAQRVAMLQAYHARPLTVALLLRGWKATEAALHTRFAAHRLNGEWFDYAPEIAAWVAAECAA